MTVRQFFGDAQVPGLLGLPAVVDAIVDLVADREIRDLLLEAAEADRLLDGDCDVDVRRVAEVRDDQARAALQRLLTPRTVRLPQDTAIDLRSALHNARLGAGSRDSSRGAQRRLA